MCVCVVCVCGVVVCVYSMVWYICGGCVCVVWCMCMWYVIVWCVCGMWCVHVVVVGCVCVWCVCMVVWNVLCGVCGMVCVCVAPLSRLPEKCDSPGRIPKSPKLLNRQPSASVQGPKEASVTLDRGRLGGSG